MKKDFNLFDLMSRFGLKFLTYKELKNNTKLAPIKEIKDLKKHLNQYDYEELIFSCHPEVGLKSIIAIHSTGLGPALGGTRMWPYRSFYEALDDALNLSEAMTFKTAAAEVDFGGGKAVIWLDPKDKNKNLLKQYALELKKLDGRFFTGEDANINMNDIVVLSKISPNSIIGKPKLARLKYGREGSGDPAPPTAKGVLYGIKACLKFVNPSADSLNAKTVAIQGIGNVGSRLLELIIKEKPRRIYISDINKNNLENLKLRHPGIKIVAPDKIHKIRCDIYSPCLTLGGIINKKTIPELKCKIIAGSTNNQLAEPFKDGELILKRGIIYAPDYIINAGGLINVADELNPAGYSKSRVKDNVKKIYGRVFQILYLSNQIKKSTVEIADILTRAKLKSALD